MSKTITVSSTQGLISALGQAKGGETILLAGGNYGNLALTAQAKVNLAFPATVTIAAADPANPPVFTGLELRNATNLTFRDITFDYSHRAGDPVTTAVFRITGGSEIALRNCLFDGDTARGLSPEADGYGAGTGLLVRNVSGLTLAGNEFREFYRGLSVTSCSDVLIAGNDVHSMRKDGMNFAQVQRITIENNRLHDFEQAPETGDHRDMIQFWTTRTTAPSTDIVIRNNLLDIGRGTPTQSIFMRNDLVDSGLAGPEMFYRNVTIEGNVIVNAHAHGITVGETAGLVIRSNSVLHADGRLADGLDAAVEIPRITVAPTSTGVVIASNATAGISGFTGQAGWTVAKNAIVQDQNALAPGFYGDVFISSSLVPTARGEHLFLARPGGLLDQLDAGAARTLSATIAPTGLGATVPLDANIHVVSPVLGGQTRVFDASVTLGDQPAGTRYLWTFGDGTAAEGRTVTHDYKKGGFYDVTLKVVTPGGATSQEALKVAVDGRELVRLDDSGRFVVSSAGQETALARPAAMTAEGLQLGGSGVAAAVARSHLTPLFATDDVTMRLVLEADRAGTTGEIARLHGSFVLSVNARGELVVRAWSSAGDAVTLATTGRAVNRGAEHEVELRLDSGRLSLWLDGRQAAEAAFRGSFADSGQGALSFGNPWGKANFLGDLAGFEIDLNDGSQHPAFDLAMTDRFATLTSNDPLF